MTKSQASPVAGDGSMNLERLRSRWQALGVPVRTGLSPEMLGAFERRYSIRLPEDVRRFYTYMDGMEYGSTDGELNCFWPLANVGSVPEKLAGFRGVPDYGGIESVLPDADSYFVFADHSVWLHVYAMRLTADPSELAPVVWIGDGRTWAPVAPSFWAFLEWYSANPRSLMFP